MSAGLAHGPAQSPKLLFSKRNVDINSEPPVAGIATRALATVTNTAPKPKTHNAVLQGNCGWSIDPAAWAKRATASKLLADQNNRIAQALQDAGEEVILNGGLTCISAVTNIVEEHRRYRAVRFLPVVAARDRRPLVNGLKLFMIEHRNAHYFRYAVMTCDELIPALGELREPIQRLSRKISKWANEVCKEIGVEVLFRGIEFTRATAAERDAEAERYGRQSDLSERYGPETVLYHVHANVLYWPTQVIEDWTGFLRDTHRFIGAEWKDCGKVEKVEEIVKYCSKPADTEKASGEELVWLFRQTEKLKICQPLGVFKTWMKSLKARREKVVRVRRESGDSELMRVKKGKRGGPMDDEEDQDKESATDGDESGDAPSVADSEPTETPQQGVQGEPVKNIVIGLTLPQWRHTPWAEPMIMVQNYEARTLSEEEGYHIREWQREAREWWDAACAPAPQKALEVARVALEAAALGTEMSSNAIREAAEAAPYIVHTCSSTVLDVERGLDSIPYVQPGEPIFEEQEQLRPPSIQEILDKPNAASRLRTISDQTDQQRRMAELRLRDITEEHKAEARKAFERDFPTGASVVAKMMSSAKAPTSEEDENHQILMEMFKEIGLQIAA